MAPTRWDSDKPPDAIDGWGNIRGFLFSEVQMFDEIEKRLSQLPLQYQIKIGHTRYQRVLYHSSRWNELVEQCWVTGTVDGANVALMIRDETFEERLNRQMRGLLSA